MFAWTFQGLSGGALFGLYGGLALAMVLLYLLKLRRREVAVPFAPLWAKVLSERQSSALFRRLKRLGSLLVQLLLLALIVGALGDPRPEAGQGCAFAPPDPPPVAHTLILVDTSSSMKAIHAGESRFEAALKAAEEVINHVGANPEARIMLASADVRVRPLTLWTKDREVVKRALLELKRAGPRDTPTDVKASLKVAAQVLREREGAEAIWITDRAFSPVSVTPDLPLSVLPVGVSGVNIGIEGFNVRPSVDDGLSYSIFFAVRNTSDTPLQAQVHLYANEEGVSAEDFVQESRILTSIALTLPPGELTSHLLHDVSFEGSRLAARVAIDTREVHHDIFEGDDLAFALVPQRKRLKVQLVSEGNLFLEASLFLRENVTLTKVLPKDYLGPEGFDVTFIDRASVDLSKPGRYVLFDPLEGGPFQIKGSLKHPKVTRVKSAHPLVKGLSFADAGIMEASKLVKAAGDEVVVAGPSGSPLILSRVDKAGGRAFVVLAFDIRQSLLPVSYAFPLFVVNALNWYQAQPEGLIATRRAGVPLSVPTRLPEGEILIHGPAELSLSRVPGRLHFTAPSIGIYDFEVSPEERMSVAINLMDAAESDLQPRGDYSLWEPAEAWVKPSSPWPGTPWRALLLVALLLLSIEWWTWHRRVTL